MPSEENVLPIWLKLVVSFPMLGSWNCLFSCMACYTPTSLDSSKPAFLVSWNALIPGPSETTMKTFGHDMRIAQTMSTMNLMRAVQRDETIWISSVRPRCRRSKVERTARFHTRCLLSLPQGPDQPHPPLQSQFLPRNPISSYPLRSVEDSSEN